MRGSSGRRLSRVAGLRHGTEPAKAQPAMRLVQPGGRNKPRRRPNHSEFTLSVHSASQSPAFHHRASDADLRRSRADVCVLAILHEVCTFRRWNGSIAQPPSQDSMQAARATVRDSVHGFRRSHGGWASNTPQCVL